MKIIKDLRILKAIGKRYDLEFDKNYKYLNSNEYSLGKNYKYKGKNYQLKFFSGCFCPYLIEIEK